MATELFTNDGSTTVSSGGTTAPVQGTVETWTVASSASFPAIGAGEQFHVADPASATTAAEIIAVTAVTGTTWTVTRGAEGTTPVAHAAGFTVENLITAGALGAFVQNPMTAAGDLIYEDATPAPARLAGNTAASKNFLTQTGDGTNSAAPAWGVIAAADVPDISSRYVPAVILTINGTKTPGSGGTGVLGNFQPRIDLAAGSTATVSWVMPDGSVITGAQPTINYSTTGTYTVRMIVTDADGRDAMHEVTGFNAGYDATIDTSPLSLGSAYNWTDYQTTFTGIANAGCMTGLEYFAAEYSGLAGTLDLSGLGALTHIDVYGAALTAVIVGGNPSLQRLDVELCDLAELDYEGCAGSVMDLRAAHQSAGGYLTFADWGASRPRQFHFCIRDQHVANPPDLSLLPAVEQLWIWNSGQAGDLKPVSVRLNDLEAESNSYRTADLAGLFPAGTNSKIYLHHNALSSVTLTGCSGLTDIDLHSNPMLQAAVDSVLAEVDSWGTYGGTLNLSGTSQPSTSGQTSVTNLQGRTWTVTVDTAATTTKFSPADSGIAVGGAASYALPVTLAKAVSAGDLLVAMVEAPSTPTVTDSAGNTWTVVKCGLAGYLAYCLSSLAAPGGITVTASLAATYPRLLAVDRFLVSGTAAFGASVSTGTGTTNGLAANSSYNLGSLGTVPAGALVWGGFASDDKTHDQWFFPGFQSGVSGTSAALGSRTPLRGPTSKVLGCGFTEYVAVAANAAAALTWYSSGTNANGAAYATAYFT